MMTLMFRVIVLLKLVDSHPDVLLQDNLINLRINFPSMMVQRQQSSSKS